MRRKGSAEADLKKEMTVGEREEFFALAFSFIMLHHSNTFIPELIHLFGDGDKLLAFIRTFGGRSFYVPSEKQFAWSLKCALAAYYSLTVQWDWGLIKSHLSLSESEVEQAKEAVKNYQLKLKATNEPLHRFFTQGQTQKKRK